MNIPDDWFEIKKEEDHIIAIQERLEKVDPRFYTHNTNIFLLLGESKALLIDTGSGVVPLKPVVKEFIDTRDLLVINTHGHWDHIGNNHEFERVYIHKNEAGFIKNPVNISNLRDSPEEIAKNYEPMDYILSPSAKVVKVEEGDEFDLGNLAVEVLHTPGHSPGSISILTHRGELFPGDLMHYGSVFLPKKKLLNTVLTSLDHILQLFDDGKVKSLYPAHGSFPHGRELVEKLIKGINNIDNLWEQKEKDQFLRSWVIDDGTFKYVISRF
ncbi:MAG: Hydroxyacylglutathione hydrolase [Promethearchaeota archaeon]|jgi:glyoxylase-like metal-dependent hydrolase (beta-lactamase superfamily II)|nr:MAG: Hydroxyacylglutathione hydrolase [Candidatus Lokiarchaeota archaeon]